METKARYLLIGGFMLAATAMVFAFVFWLNRGGGLGQKQTYIVRFGDAASGLQSGAAVLFNGVRVGEVSDVKLDPADFQHVLARISVRDGTPLRKDTKVGMEFQGLMGTAAVSLTGGTSDTLLTTPNDGSPATLIADPDSENSLTKTARDTLSRIDKLIADNSDALGSSIANLKTFSAALARNSDRIDGVMAGLDRMTGGGPAKPTLQVYDLDIPRIASGSVPSRTQFLISDVTAVVALQTQRLLKRTAEGQLVTLGEIQWSDAIPKMLQEKVFQGLQDAGVSVTLDPPLNSKPDDRQLQIDLRDFEIEATVPAVANVAFSATIVSGDGKILDMKIFKAEAPILTEGADAAPVKALNAAFGKALEDLADWMRHLS